MTEKVIEKKTSKLQERLGYIALGACIDYFIFKPIRYFKSAIVFGAGFGLGILVSGWGRAAVDYFLK